MIRLGTRASTLAMIQAEAVAVRLRAIGATVEIRPMRTEGDRLADMRLAEVGGKGLFVRDIEQALTRGEIDIAVHSLKDLPADVAPGLTVCAYPEREDARDVLVGGTRVGLGDLRGGSVVGTSSPRRRALILAERPDLRVEPIRGNVDTRLRKLAAGDFDAIVLAAAGLVRLGVALDRPVPLDPDVFVPAVGQGIIGVEAREGDRETLGWLERIDDPMVRACALAERAYLRRLGASCTTPMAAHARLEGERMRIDGVVASEDGANVLRETVAGASRSAAELGLALAESLLARGAASITDLRPESWTHRAAGSSVARTAGRGSA